MARVALAGVLSALVVVGSSAAATMPAFLLRDGQTRYLTPAEATTDALVRCVVDGSKLDARLSAPPSAGSTTGTQMWAHGGAELSIGQRPNGATELRCGSATAGTGFFGQSPDPYVIGQNGLALIQGRNRLAALERIYGAPGAVQSRPCRATWRTIGLAATFADDRCNAGSVLAGAVVQGARWRSLSGAQVGESVGKLLWDAQTARPLAHGRWLLASGGTSRHARLVAETSVGAVARLVLTGV
jgi:hypothetical protein